MTHTQDFDQLVTALKPFVTATADAACDTALVFNCHMGRGRTTTGMVCASILTLAARGWAPPEGAPLALPAPDACGRDPARGEYASILQLLQVVDQAAHRPELEPTPSKFKKRLRRHGQHKRMKRGHTLLSSVKLLKHNSMQRFLHVNITTNRCSSWHSTNRKSSGF